MNELAVGVGHHADLGRGDAVLDETLDHERTVAAGNQQCAARDQPQRIYA